MRLYRTIVLSLAVPATESVVVCPINVIALEIARYTSPACLSRRNDDGITVNSRAYGFVDIEKGRSKSSNAFRLRRAGSGEKQRGEERIELPAFPRCRPSKQKPGCQIARRELQNSAAAETANDRKANGAPPDQQRHNARVVEPEVVPESPLPLVRDAYNFQISHVLHIFLFAISVPKRTPALGFSLGICEFPALF